MRSLLFLFLISYNIHAQKAGKTYLLQSAIADKYLDIQWSNTKNATPLHLWPYNGSGAQQFTLKDARNGYFYIKTVLANNTYVHVQNRSNKPKALAHLWKGKGNDNTKWSFIPASNGYYFIRSKKGTYLDVKKGNSANGTPIWVYSFNGSKTQQWKLKEVPSYLVYRPEQTLQEISVGKIELYKKKVSLKTLSNLCPSKLVGGDLEFGGNGPKVFGMVNLYVSQDNKEIIAHVNFNAQETKSDFLTGRSEVKGSWKISIYRAPRNIYINGIVDYANTISNFNKVLKNGGANELYGGGSDGSSHILNHSNWLNGKGFVSQIEVVGDTGGWDISTDNNCTNDTRLLKIIFNSIELEFIKAQK